MYEWSSWKEITLEQGSPSANGPHSSRPDQQHTIRKMVLFCRRPVRERDAKGFHSEKKHMRPHHTLTSQLWEIVGCLLKSKLSWHPTFTPFSSYLNLDQERCTLLHCLICFHKEHCALSRCKNLFHSNWQCLIME